MIVKHLNLLNILNHKEQMINLENIKLMMKRIKKKILIFIVAMIIRKILKKFL